MIHHSDTIFMARCLDLARLGAGWVAPNPMVGAVIVHENVIIGEGYHTHFGAPHAEVAAFHHVAPHKKHLLRQSTLYVSLEPCSHYGKTPPCAEAIIAHGIPRVVVACTDPNPMVAGRGIEKLRQAGIVVIEGIMAAESRQLNKAFHIFHEQQRPLVVLKFARSSNGQIAQKGTQTWLTGAMSRQLVHRWRSELAAVMVGTETALIDNPRLDNRFYFGKKPLRIVLDRQGRLPLSAHLLDGSQPTLVFTAQKSPKSIENVTFVETNFERDFLAYILKYMYEQLRINSILVEGGSKLLQSFIEANLWDEARIFTANKVFISDGTPEPKLHNARLVRSEQIGNDLLSWYENERLEGVTF